MESVEELMKRMNLTEAEARGIKVWGAGASRETGKMVQAVGKVFSERLVNTEGLAHALGRIWCPMRGVTCKDLGENLFLFTFNQAVGKRRALEDGPWMFGKDLVVMADFDESKSLEELEFIYIPIWLRISKLPFSMMNKTVGEAIGEEMGVFMEMDKEDDGTAVGRFLRIKIRMDIRRPLRRGVLVQVEWEKGEPRPLWCPVVYEYLPDFCYTCGLIGHIDKACATKLQKGEVQLYSKDLRFIPERRRSEDGEGERGWQSRTSWRQGGSGSRGSWGSGGRLVARSGTGSDAPSWRKPDASAGTLGLKARGEEDEVTSPVKKKENVDGAVLKAKKALVLGEQNESGEVGQKVAMSMDVNRGMQPMHVENRPLVFEGKEKVVGQEDGKRKGTFKRTPRIKGDEGSEKQVKEAGRKRSSGEIGSDVE
jgi:hypothetical protein